MLYATRDLLLVNVAMMYPRTEQAKPICQGWASLGLATRRMALSQAKQPLSVSTTKQLASALSLYLCDGCPLLRSDQETLGRVTCTHQVESQNPSSHFPLEGTGCLLRGCQGLVCSAWDVHASPA